MVPGWWVSNNPTLKSLDSGEPWIKNKYSRNSNRSIHGAY